MMRYTILYPIAVIFALSQLFGFPGLLIAILLVIIASLFNEISVRKTELTIEGLQTRTGELAEKISAASQQFNDIKSSSEKSLFALENRIDEIKTDYRLELESQYRDLARKIIEMENRLLEIKKTIGAAFGSLEDRMENR